MDRRAPDPPGERDMVYCHQCEQQWYRDEHGLECPHCHSDFTEVIEASNDPRHIDDVPDPDIDDIEHVGWPSSPGETPHRFHARIERTPSGNVREAQQGQTSSVAGMIGSALQSFIGGIMQAPIPDDQHRNQNEQDNTRRRQSITQRSVTPSGTTITRHVHGDGYSFTMTTTSGGSLRPRDANSPQQFQQQPESMDDIMRQMLMNIGAFSPGMHPGDPGMRRSPFPPGAHGLPSPDMDGRPMPFPAMLFSLLGMPHNGQLGDAVYSQEGLDRIISQLMEQHQTGHAPGPATESAIASLPTRKITKTDLGESETVDCSICMESVSEGDTVTVLPCQHWFHGDCIKLWLNAHDTCPHCRQGIMPREGDSSSSRRPAEAPLNDMHSPANTRSTVPGSYPFPRQNSASGHSRSRSPEMRRRTSSAGVFDRMREAFHGNNRRQT